MKLSLFPIAFLCAGAVIPSVPRRSVQWPRPASGYVRRTTNNICLSGSVTGEAPTGVLTQNKNVIPTAIQSLNSELSLTTRQIDCGKNGIAKIGIQITADNDIGPSMTEDYTLSVSETSINISASSVWGARHAITTLQNMLEVYNTVPISFAHYAKNIVGDVAHFYYILPYGPQFTITDVPRLGHRGLMVDTSRHYIEYTILQRIIRTMSRAKLNVFHWHATDDQSFPLVLTNSAATIHGTADCTTRGICSGAYSNSMIYTHNQAKTLVEYARDRGVRVILEIDQPSHARSWANRDTSLRECAGIDSQLPGFCNQPICGPLALSQNYANVRKLANLINTDILDIVQAGEHIHIGMDEIGASCWGDATRDTLTLKWLEDSLNDLLNRDGATANRKIVIWQDGLHFSTDVTLPDIATNIIGQIWTDPSEALTFLQNGRDVVWSNYHVMYLDCGRGNHAVFTNPSWCGEFKLWWDIYRESPDLSISVTAKPGIIPGRILGGEVALWGEQADSNNIEGLLWPRAVAWAGASWEARTSVPPAPNDTSSIAAAFAVEKNVISFNYMVSFLDSVPFTPVSVQWCAYEDETYCQKYAEFYFTSTTTPRPTSAAGVTYNVTLFTLLLAILFR